LKTLYSGIPFNNRIKVAYFLFGYASDEKSESGCARLRFAPVLRLLNCNARKLRLWLISHLSTILHAKIPICL